MNKSDFARKVADAKTAMRRTPVYSLSDLYTLNPDEIEEGFKDGYEGFPCSDNRSRAYWHGWRCAGIDKGRIPMDWQARMLAHELAPGGALKSIEEHQKQYEWLKSLGLAED